MLTLYDGTSNIKLSDGTILTPDDLNNSAYSILLKVSCAIKMVDGYLLEICPMHALKDKYSVDDSDDETALSKINAKIEADKIAEQTVQAKEASVTKVAKIMALSFTDEQAIEVVDLYPEYEIDHAYKQNDRFQYNGSLYKVNQNHTSQAQWVPGESGTESLYTNLMLDESGYQIWKQPTGAHNAYNTGDIVRYPDKDGQLYKSLIDGNAYSPDTYPQGWEVYTEE